MFRIVEHQEGHHSNQQLFGGKTMLRQLTLAALTVSLTAGLANAEPKFKVRFANGPKTQVQKFVLPGGNTQQYVAPGNSAKYYIPPQPQPQPIPQPMLGFQGHYDCGQGMHVDSVNWNSTAQRIGLEAGDTIYSINGVRITSHAHYLRLLQEAVMFHGGHVELQIRNGRPWPAPQWVTVSFHLNTPGYPGGPSYPSSAASSISMHPHP